LKNSPASISIPTLPNDLQIFTLRNYGPDLQ
jgi:hypothetical protein